jgi:hypothetical protein
MMSRISMEQPLKGSDSTNVWGQDGILATATEVLKSVFFTTLQWQMTSLLQKTHWVIGSDLPGIFKGLINFCAFYLPQIV